MRNQNPEVLRSSEDLSGQNKKDKIHFFIRSSIRFLGFL